MAKKNYEFIPVHLPKKLRARVVKLARAEKRGIGRTAELLIEKGIAEYDRQRQGATA